MRDSVKRRRLSAWLQGDGIEIGALHNPLPLPPGARVRYVDHLPEAELRRHYPELHGQPFAPVSIIGSAQDLSMVGDASVDFVVANHLLEHLEDPVAGLKEFQRVLRPDGVVYLALPDKRRTFDRDRELTPVEHLLDEHRQGAEPNRRQHYIDWATGVDKKDEAHAAALLEKGYSIHFHVWRADTFLDFLVAARREFGLDFEIAQFAGPETEEDDEFILVLVKGRNDRVRLPAALPGNGEAAGAASRGRLARARARLVRR
jgi:SAM-dependent methyltransferase